MIIALYNLETKKPKKIYNTAMMQVSRYHKDLGHIVEIYRAENHHKYDRIYVFSIFDFTPKPSWIFSDSRVIYGGTGFDPEIKLPAAIAQCNYDWSLYPDCKYSIVRFSRGCIRNCPFCIVRQKEGYIRPVKPKNLNPNATHVRVYDNNFFANPEWRKAVKQLIEWNEIGLKTQFDGVDVRLLDEEMCEALNTIKMNNTRNIHIAWDLPKIDIRPQLDKVLQWVKGYKFICYVLVGFNSTIEQDLFRIHELMKRNVDPFVMIYNKRQDSPLLEKLARWCNKAPIRRACTFDEYLQTYDLTISKMVHQKKLTDYFSPTKIIQSE